MARKIKTAVHQRITIRVHEQDLPPEAQPTEGQEPTTVEPYTRAAGVAAKRLEGMALGGQVTFITARMTVVR